MPLIRWSFYGIASLAVLGSTSAIAGGAAIELRGRGVQIYACEQDAGGFAWRLKGPEATLLDATGAEVGRHFAGPSWQAKDGSKVIGEVLASNRAPAEGSIPWLILRAKSRSGNGVFASADYILRLQTEGGVAPTGGCDQARTGSETRVPYNAVYVFFSEP